VRAGRLPRHAGCADQKRIKAAALVADSTLPFKVSFDTAQSFITGPRHRPLVLTGTEGIVGLSGFYKNLSGALLKTSGLRSRRATRRTSPCCTTTSPPHRKA
jgi:hypothetical protein